MPIVWSSEFETGLRAIDLQHRELIELINRLDEARRTDVPHAVETVLPQLTAYVLFHFSTEEALFANAPSYAAHAAAHIAQHQKFAQSISEYKHWSRDELIARCPEIAAFLHDWLLHHIRGTDQAMGALIGERR